MNPELVAFLTSWSWEPTIVLGLGLALGLYAVGWWRLQRRSRGKNAVEVWRALCYGCGNLLIGIALLSPIATFAGLLLIMHMIQHVLLISAAPLILLGKPLLPTLWALPLDLRRGLGRLFVPDHPLHRPFRALTNPAVGVTIYVLTLFVWHVPRLYDVAQGYTVVHYLQHVTLIGSAMLFWWSIINPTGGRRRLNYGSAIFYLVPPMLEPHVLGMVLTFAGRPLYLTYQQVPRLWGLSVLLDQQIAGAIMWVAGEIPHLVAVSVLLVLFLRQEEQRADGLIKE